jgi:hypothetical protein
MTKKFDFHLSLNFFNIFWPILIIFPLPIGQKILPDWFWIASITLNIISALNILYEKFKQGYLIKDLLFKISFESEDN